MSNREKILDAQYYRKSFKWYIRRAILDITTCGMCRKLHGHIYTKEEAKLLKIPLHLFCRCSLEGIGIIAPGEATEEGNNGADVTLFYSKELPDKYITKNQAQNIGWKPKKGNLAEIAPGKSIGGDVYKNHDGRLPQSNGRIWYEADINYSSGFRGSVRIFYSNDGLIFVSYDHGQTFFIVSNQEQ